VRAYARLLRHRSFAFLWTGATVSLIGDGLTWVSLVWLVYELGGGAPEIGLLAACYSGPVIIGGLAAGILLDRFDRRRLLIADNVIRGLAVLSIPLAAWAGVLALPQLYAVAAIYGLLYMTSLAGYPTILPDLVEPDELSTANAMESLGFGIGGIAGPILAGFLITVIGPTANLAIDALTYLVFVVCLTFVRLPRPAEGSEAAGDAGEPAASTTPTKGRGLRPAVAFALRTPAIVATTLMFMSANVGEGMLTVLLPVYTRDVLAADAATYGLLIGAFTVGLLAGSVAVGAIRWPWTLGRSIAAAQLVGGLAVLGLLAQPAFAGTLVVLAAVGALLSPLTIWAQTVRMRLIPAELRGRVFSLLRTLMQSTPPIGGLVAGTALAGGGLTPTVLVMAALIAVPGAIGLGIAGLAPRAVGETLADAPTARAVAAADEGIPTSG
jgi:MFS family permease